MNLIKQIELEEIKKILSTRGISKITNFSIGDFIVVKTNIIEGNKKRIQSYEGIVISKRNRGLNSSFTVLRISSGEKIERTFQTYSFQISSIIIKRFGDVRRSKLYFLRSRSGKSARIKKKI